MLLSTADGWSSTPNLLPGHSLPPIGSLAGVLLLSTAAVSCNCASHVSPSYRSVKHRKFPIVCLHSVSSYSLAVQPPHYLFKPTFGDLVGAHNNTEQGGGKSAEFLYDNILEVRRLQELGHNGPSLHSAVSTSHFRDVPDALTWESCFLAFMAAKIDNAETRQLAAYGMIVLQLALQHRGSGWRLYDYQQHAAGAKIFWTEINPSLMAATVLCSGPSQT